ncbi:MAG: UDP-N-acetylmuramoyl-L-alanyl-D-glutamate--2,6-diaminopimelate ligase [Clostridia bacterium]|nr:UDP-N-acetylmuramoyl-L-alanyl-D-glutamate--2,6-diaminopimelate ligase [Clostridia bacterium]
MKIFDIIYSDEFIISDINENIDVGNLTTDINNIREDSILIIPNSLKLPKEISSAKIPLAVICDLNAALPKCFPTIRVSNPRLALARAYYRFVGFDSEGITMIGVTGTNGKTSTAEFIKTILLASGQKVGFIGTGRIEINGEILSDKYYSMTTPDPHILYPTLKKMKDTGCTAIVMEVSSHALALDKVEPLKFDYGVFTNLSSEHMDFHRSLEEYFDSKNKLFKQCKKSIFNVDDEYARRAYDICSGEKISAGIIWRGDVWASNIENRGFDGISYIYHTDRFSFKMNLNVAGIYNAYNSMLATALCIDMGIRPCEAKRILGEIDRIPGRYEIINDEISVIIDYAHTDSAFNNIMKELAALKGSKKLTVIFGCGGCRDKDKRPKMARIAEKYADRIIITTDNSRTESPKEIIADIIKGFVSGSYRVIEDRTQAIRTAIIEADSADVIAIIGKGCEKYNIDNSGYHDFSERDIAISALKRRKAKV